MGKLTGGLLILGGCGGFLWSWWCLQKKRQAAAVELIRFFSQWEYSLEKEKLRLCEFLDRYECGQPQVREFLDDLREALRRREYLSGAVMWRQVLTRHRAGLGLGADMWELLLHADGVFFGTSSRESLRCTMACKKRMEECLGREEKEFFKRQRVYMPVGMLAGILLIILLI